MSIAEGKGKPRTRISRRQLVTSKSGRTYYKYIYDDAQLTRTRPTKPQKSTSVVVAIKNGAPMTRGDFEKKYPSKSYKKYRSKLKRVKERLI